MKANRFFILNVFVLLTYVLLVVFSCSDKDDGPDRNPIEKEYFSIKEAEYVGNDFPQATGSIALASGKYEQKCAGRRVFGCNFSI